MGRKSNHLMERVYAHLSKNGCRKSGFLADPDLTGTLLVLDHSEIKEVKIYMIYFLI
jgi:hypothetical protein